MPDQSSSNIQVWIILILSVQPRYCCSLADPLLFSFNYFSSSLFVQHIIMQMQLKVLFRGKQSEVHINRTERKEGRRAQVLKQQVRKKNLSITQ